VKANLVKGKSMRKLFVSVIVLVASANLAGCGYNKLQNQDEAVKAAWSEVVNQYQRRADLIPNLVATVKGFAAQEERVLVGVTEARAKATSIQLTPELLNNPEAFAKFQESQNQLTAALKTLLSTVEAYPELKSNENFRDLQVQLEGTENRIAVARNRYIDAVKGYNVTVREFPTNLTAKWFDFEVKPNFTVQNEAAVSTAPTVGFDTSTPSKSAGPVESSPTSSPATPPPAN
jgi:LemA protein